MSTAKATAQLQAQAPIFSNPGLRRITKQDQLPPPNTGKQEGIKKPRSHVHFFAGGVGGMVAAICTSPLDVVKTRLQSSYYKKSSAITSPTRPSQLRSILLVEIYRHEGLGALFKGLGANLVGVVPARAINFWTYGNCKRVFTELNGKETPLVYLGSAMAAGLVTATMTNPIWMIKTRMQLQQSGRDQNLHHIMTRKYKNSFDCAYQIMRDEGFKGLYKGMSASYLGVAEGTIHWVIYEAGKAKLAEQKQQRLQEQGSPISRSPSFVVGGKDSTDWLAHIGTAAFAKFVAACICYPHEVIRTRLRQPAENGVRKYTGLIQCFQTVLREEGFRAFYGGMTTHLIRVVPNAAIMFFCYEAILHQWA